MTAFRKGSRVKWHWGSGEAHGTIAERFDADVTRTIKGSKITRHGSKDNPAYLIEQEDGGKVLKLASEIEADRD